MFFMDSSSNLPPTGDFHKALFQLSSDVIDSTLIETDFPSLSESFGLRKLEVKPLKTVLILKLVVMVQSLVWILTNWR